MRNATIKKLKSVRGSGIAEALVGFLICVLSVLALLAIATTTTNLIKDGDARIQVLYQEEGQMDAFVNQGGIISPENGGELYSVYTPEGGTQQKYHLTATGKIHDGTSMDATGDVAYYVTQRLNLFGLVPNAN